MKIEKINLPKVEMFPCKVGNAKHLFADMESLTFTFGRSHLHIPRYTHLKLVGLPVAQASYSTSFASGHIHVFPLRRDEYSAAAALDFETCILPTLREWMVSQYSAPETAPVERDELFVTWLEGKHSITTWRLKKG